MARFSTFKVTFMVACIVCGVSAGWFRAEEPSTTPSAEEGSSPKARHVRQLPSAPAASAPSEGGVSDAPSDQSVPSTGEGVPPPPSGVPPLPSGVPPPPSGVPLSPSGVPPPPAGIPARADLPNPEVPSDSTPSTLSESSSLPAGPNADIPSPPSGVPTDSSNLPPVAEDGTSTPALPEALPQRRDLTEVGVPSSEPSGGTTPSLATNLPTDIKAD